ncbi:hypothetical protein THAOC_23998, partial [Thalassiosira oceanica]
LPPLLGEVAVPRPVPAGRRGHRVLGPRRPPPHRLLHLGNRRAAHVRELPDGVPEGRAGIGRRERVVPEPIEGGPQSVREVSPGQRRGVQEEAAGGVLPGDLPHRPGGHRRHLIPPPVIPAAVDLLPLAAPRVQVERRHDNVRVRRLDPRELEGPPPRVRR